MADEPNREVIDQLTDKNAPKPAPIDLKAPVKQVIDGKEVTKTLEEWLALANKGVGADQKFQEAAEARAVAAAVDALHNPSTTPEQKADAQKVIFKRAGMTDDAINRAIYGEQQDPTAEAKPVPNNVEPRLEAREHQLNEMYELQLDQAVENLVNGDSDFRVYLQSEFGPVPEGRKAEFAKVLRDKAMESMRLRATGGEKFSARWIGPAVANAKAEALKYAQQVIGAPSLGRAPETMLGSDVASLAKDPKVPARGTRDLNEYQKYVTGVLVKEALDSNYFARR